MVYLNVYHSVFASYHTLNEEVWKMGDHFPQKKIVNDKLICIDKEHYIIGIRFETLKLFNNSHKLV